MGYRAKLGQLVQYLKNKQGASYSPISCKISRNYSVQEYVADQDAIVAGELESFHQVVNVKRFKGCIFTLRLLIGDTAQRYRQESKGLSLHEAYRISLINGADFYKKMRPAVLHLLRKKKNYTLIIDPVMWNQELLEEVPENCIPPKFDDPEFDQKYEIWYAAYVRQSHLDLTDKNKLSQLFQKNQSFVSQECEKNEDLKSELESAAKEFVRHFSLRKTKENDVIKNSLRLFDEEVAIFSKQDDEGFEVLLYGVSSEGSKKPRIISESVIKVTRHMLNLKKINLEDPPPHEFILFEYSPLTKDEVEPTDGQEDQQAYFQEFEWPTRPRSVRFFQGRTREESVNSYLAKPEISRSESSLSMEKNSERRTKSWPPSNKERKRHESIFPFLRGFPEIRELQRNQGTAQPRNLEYVLFTERMMVIEMKRMMAKEEKDKAKTKKAKAEEEKAKAEAKKAEAEEKKAQAKMKLYENRALYYQAKTDELRTKELTEPESSEFSNDLK